jgi:hypothetical protein
MAGLFMVFTAITIYVITYMRHETSIGTRRKKIGAEDAEAEEESRDISRLNGDSNGKQSNGTNDNVLIQVSTRQDNTGLSGVLDAPAMQREISAVASTLPFVPITLSWLNIGYSVPVKGKEKVLISDINGYCMFYNKCS